MISLLSQAPRRSRQVLFLSGNTRVNYFWVSKYLEENAGGAAVKLTNEDIAAITKFANDADLPGDRYGGTVGGMVHVESPEL